MLVTTRSVYGTQAVLFQPIQSPKKCSLADRVAFVDDRSLP